MKKNLQFPRRSRLLGLLSLVLLGGTCSASAAVVRVALDTAQVTEAAGNTASHAVEVAGSTIHVFDTTETGADRTSSQAITDPGSDLLNYHVTFVHTSTDTDGSGNMFFLEIGDGATQFARLAINRISGTDRIGRSDGNTTQITDPQNLTSGTAYAVSLFLNNTGGAEGYTDPVGGTQTLAAGTYDIWFGPLAGSLGLIRDGQAAEGAVTGLDTVRYRMRSVAKIRFDTEWSPTPWPDPTLATAADTVSGPFTVTVDFGVDVTGLEESDFVVTNGAVEPSSLTGSGAAYSVGIVPAGNGHVTVRLPQGVAMDLDNNTSLESNLLLVTHVAPGSDQPVADMSTAAALVSGPFTVDLTFSEPVSGMALADLTIGNGTPSNLQGTGAAYTFVVTPAVAGAVTVDLAPGSVTDTDGDGLGNPAPATLAVTYEIPENPTVALYGRTHSDTVSYEVFVTFSEEITGLADSDFQVVNGSASGTVSTSANTADTHQTPLQGRFYKTTITAAKPGEVRVSLPAGVVNAATGLQEPNLAASNLVTVCGSDFGEVWVIDEAADWTASTHTSTNLTISGGYAEPTADSATFTSIVKTYPRKRRADSLTFHQSPVWDNWTGVPNVAPPGAGDAPILLPVADKDYYFLGKGSTQAYYAWHSTNMVDWVGPSRVTEEGGNNGRWSTSAEYKDGKFYVLYDGPNDEDPALYIDDDLMDGVPGTKIGTVFHDPSHGSDSSIIRSDEDGLFHIIYEDWSPILARTHAWDSPLGGHTSSPDAISGFEPHEHQPIVDHRIGPTGTFSTYVHPNGTYTYEVHAPTQDAYGDWTSIKIGSRFYLFSDYEEHGVGIKVARFTSDSIYKEFDLVGSLGNGHPDPTVGFAEGRFYLITQQSTDYTSPGPWVDGVEARAGVDIDGNGSIDQWTTGWQGIAESYDHKAGYARVVDVSPARLDLSGLPAGYGFQFEFRVDNTVVPGVPPIMDRVEWQFEPGNFQKWSNANDTPALPLGDHNANGLPNLVEFALGQTWPPRVGGAGMTLNVVTSQEALEEEYEVETWFTEALTPPDWKAASVELPAGVTLRGSHINGDGDLLREFSFSPEIERLFWRIGVNDPGTED